MIPTVKIELLPQTWRLPYKINDAKKVYKTKESYCKEKQKFIVKKHFIYFHKKLLFLFVLNCPDPGAEDRERIFIGIRCN